MQSTVQNSKEKCCQSFKKLFALYFMAAILVMIGVNYRLYTGKDKDNETKYWNTPSPFTNAPPKPSGASDIAYIRSLISPEQPIEREEHQPKILTISCNDTSITITSFYSRAAEKPAGKYYTPVTCADILQKSLCPGQMYLEDPRLKSILGQVSEYLPHNVLTENDLKMASLVLEFKNQPKIDYIPNYEEPKLAYVIMSAKYPQLLHNSINHIRQYARPDTTIYSTFDYNSLKWKEYQQVMQNFTDIKVLPTHYFGNWGGISLVYMEISAWLELLKMGGWDYLINISDTDGFLVPADIVQQRVKQLNGSSILECIDYKNKLTVSQGRDNSCTFQNADYRYTDVWVDCGSSVRTANHTKFKPVLPPYIHKGVKSAQWKLLSRSVIEKFVSSQDFWDIIFSCRNTLVPDEHAIINAARRILPKEPFIYHNIHYKFWDGGNIPETVVKKALEGDFWFIRKLYTDKQFAVVNRLREERYPRQPT